MDSQIIGQILALFTALCWALNSMTYNILGKSIKSSTLAHARSLLAVPIVFILMIATEGLEILSISRQTLFALIFSGITGYFITDILMFYSYVALGAREALVILTFSPVVSAILSNIFFSEVLSLKQWSAIILIILGIIIMVLDEILQNRGNRDRRKLVKGIICAVLGAFFQSISYIAARYALNDIGPISTNFLRNFSGLICFIVLSFLPKSTFKSDVRFVKDKKKFTQLLFAVVTGPVLGMSFQMLALRLAPVGIVTALSQISPLFMLPIDKYYLKKEISKKSYIGTFISIIGTVVMFI